MDSMKRMKELIPLLTQASRAYYQEDRELMSNYEYDKLYDYRGGKPVKNPGKYRNPEKKYKKNRRI